jgi:hypothetical protein
MNAYMTDFFNNHIEAEIVKKHLKMLNIKKVRTMYWGSLIDHNLSAITKIKELLEREGYFLSFTWGDVNKHFGEIDFSFWK